MSNLLLSDATVTFRPGAIVAPGDDLLGVQGPDGSLVPCEKLGPGVVEQVLAEGAVYVRWTEAGFDTWMEPGDLRSHGMHAHLIAVYRCDGHGTSKLVRNMVITGSGFESNWTVELRPKQVVRVIRSDGHAWTFVYNWIFRHLTTPCWTFPPDDEDAEAYTAAELSMLKHPKR